MYGYPVTPPKKRARSKVYWVNGVILALAAVEANFQALEPLLPVSVWQVLAFLVPVVNLVLREYTHQAVGEDGVGVSNSNHVAAAVIVAVGLIVAAVIFAWPR